MNDCRSDGLLLEEKEKTCAALTFPGNGKVRYMPSPGINRVAFGVGVSSIKSICLAVLCLREHESKKVPHDEGSSCLHLFPNVFLQL